MSGKHYIIDDDGGLVFFMSLSQTENRGRVMEKQLFSRLTKFLKKSPEKMKVPILGRNFFEKLRL